MKYSAKSSFPEKKIKVMYLFGVLFLLLSIVLGIMLGSTELTFSEILGGIKNGFNSSPGARIFGYVRLPRILASVLCGAALSMAGAVIQGVLANPLASPGIIGVNSGAGLAVTVAGAFGIMGGWSLSVISFAGAFAAVMAVSLGAKKWGASKGTVILMGVAMNSLFGAVSDTVITFYPDVGVFSRDFRVGDFSGITMERLIPAGVLIFLGGVVIMTLSTELDVLTLGEESALGLGMNTALMRPLFLLLSALLAGCAVSIAGLVSFVGLLVPHTVRRLGGTRSVHLLGLSVLYGGGFVSLCDTVARTVFSPYEIPVGIITAFLGAPFFLFVLIRKKGGVHRDRV